MLDSGEILAGLEQIAKKGMAFAVFWHFAIGAAMVGLLFGWRPSRRLAGVFLCVPLASVSAFAWAFRNAFNGTIFAVLAIVLGWLAWHAPTGEPPFRFWWSTLLGGVLVTFAWVYPHFLDGQEMSAFLYGAPLEIIPCPTLSLLVGVTLMGWAPRGRAWSRVLTGVSVFYALFGALRLYVVIDWVLLAGSIGLIAQTMALAMGEIKNHRKESCHGTRL